MRVLAPALCILTLASVVWAEPVEWPVIEGGNGHFYEVVGGTNVGIPELTWEEADILAKSMNHQGLAGHLVTLTSLAEQYFVGALPGVQCNYVNGDDVCSVMHIGGWSTVVEVIDPQPYNPPYVLTTDEQWITGEVGSYSLPVTWLVGGPVGQTICYQWGIYSMDGFGYPDYGPHGKRMEEDSGTGYIVEYDEFPAYHYPEGSVATTDSRWGDVKALFR